MGETSASPAAVRQAMQRQLRRLDATVDRMIASVASAQGIPWPDDDD